MAYTYTQYISYMQTLAPTNSSDTNFAAIQNMMIDDAEQRCYRALNLLDETVRDSSATLTISSRNFTLPTTNGTFISVEQFNVITPVGTSNADSGTRNPMTAASKEFLDALWPSSTGSTVPQYFAPITQDTFIVAPFPDQGYNVEVVGVQRPTPLYISQTTSPLSVYFPDLFVAASMVFLTGYQRDYGKMSDDPQAAVSWEQHYNSLLTDAKTEEARKRFLADRYESSPPVPMNPKGA
jgi:hypothetical protein